MADIKQSALESVSYTHLSAQLSAKPYEVAAAVEKLKAESLALKQEMNGLKMDILDVYKRQGCGSCQRKLQTDAGRGCL